jgi:selenocysteine lyase/cysteine desulfurase
MLTCQKQEFALPAGLHYLNCAFLGPMAKAVEAAGIAGIAVRRDPRNLRAEDFFSPADEVRELFARLVNAPDPGRIAILPAVSYGMAIAARNLPVARGQRIVIAHEQFPSNVLPWRRLADERGATLHTVMPPETDEGRGEEWNQRFLDAVTPETAIVALPNVHWADGTRFDLESIGGRAREVGAALVVDGTQSVGAMPFDVGRVQPDVLVCAAYKWLLGPYGLALGYFGERLDNGVPLEENWINREGSEDFSTLVRYGEEYRPGASRYDMGERSNPVLLPMAAAALRMIASWQIERIQEYCASLVRPAVEELRAAGFVVEDRRWRGEHLFGIRLPAGQDPRDVGRLLESRNVVISVRSDSIRVSPNVYNDSDDLSALVSAITGAS